MLIPVRCFTCGNLIADKFESYRTEVRAGKDTAAALDSLGIRRYCCRRMMLTTVETIQQIVPFYEAVNKRRLEIEHELE